MQPHHWRFAVAWARAGLCLIIAWGLGIFETRDLFGQEPAPAPNVGRAAAPAPPPPSILERLERLEKADAASVWRKLGFKLSGFVDVAYTQNFNNPASDLNQLHIFDTNANSFMPHLTQLLFDRPADASGGLTDRAGFRARLNFGLDSRVTRARTNFQEGTVNNELDFQEMYAQYIVPIGHGLDVKVGKINTLIGYEVINSYENPNFSRTFMFGLGQAFTTTGIRLSYQVSPTIVATAGLVNGWDDVDAPNLGKTVEWLLSFTPHERFSANFYGSYGFQQANRTFGNPATGGTGPGNPNAERTAIGAYFTFKATDQDTFVLEPYYVNEASNPAVASNPALRPNARWNGIVLYQIHDFTEQWSLRSRGEIFEDAGGSRTCGGTFNNAGGTNTCFGATNTTPATPIGLTLWETTFTLQYKPIPSLINRVEFRTDHADHPVFQRRTGATNHQETLSFEVIYLF